MNSPSEESILSRDGWVQVSPVDLRLPHCPIPRPDDRVFWYSDARPMRGTLKGHDILGNALILNDFGNPTTKPFSEIRLDDPEKSRLPNWHYLPATGLIVRPAKPLRDRIGQSLARRIPPGPAYIDLVQEIWNRGFEIFLVGGTVRDLILGASANDIDLVTTMPLSFAQNFLQSMFRYDPSTFPKRGYIRIGGSNAGGDPTVDLKVFSDSLPGTRDATFGADFCRDVAHRDFACNAVYYDPCNEVLIDPTGQGITDACEKRLSIICASGDPYQQAQVFIRAIKFIMRGFVASDATKSYLAQDLRRAMPSMRRSIRISYFRRQVLSKYPNARDHAEALDNFHATLVDMGLGEVWDEFFAPIQDGILR